MFVHALAVQAFGRHARGSGSDLVLRLKVDALRFQRSVIDACVDIKLGKALVDMIGPRFAPVGEKFGAVPVADFGSKTLLVHLAHGQHDMGVWLGFAVSADIPMNIEVGDHPAIDKLATYKVTGQLDSRSEEHT